MTRENSLWVGELDGLVGRDDTLATLKRLLDSGSRTAVVTGVAGAGKTAVLSVAARAEAAEGRLVLWLTCHESERDLSFVALTDVLSSVPGAEHVVAQLTSVAGGVGSDPLQLRLEVLSWLEALSDDRPTVLVVDDAHWCDDSSLSVLSFVSHRLAGSSASLVVGARGETAPAPLQRHPVLHLPPLDDSDAKALLRRAGLAIDSLSLPTVIDRAAGNPLALLELGRRAAAHGADAVPSTVESAFADQLAGLPRPTQRALLLAAADDGDGDMAVLTRAISPQPLLEALGPAEEAGLVAVTDHVLRFRHPLIRSAAYLSAAEADRVAAHAALASAHEDDPERAAWHRAEATVFPDAEVASALAEAAEQAWRRGASAESARFMVRAAVLSPGARDRDQRFLDAVLTAIRAGDFEWAIEVGSRLQREAEDAAVRLGAAHATAFALAQTVHPHRARRLLLELLEKSLDIDLKLGWAALTTLAVLTYRTGWDGAVIARWLERYRTATRAALPGDPSPLLLAAESWVRVQIDPVARPDDLVAYVRDVPVPDLPIREQASHEMLLGAAAWLLDDPSTALERLTRSLELMRQAEAPGEMTQTLSARAAVLFSTGDYDAVDDAGRLILDIAEARTQSSAAVDGYELRGRVAGIRGDVGAARELCDRVLQETRAGESLAYEAAVRTAMAWVWLYERDPQRSWEEISWLFREDGAPRHVHISYRELGHYAAAAARSGAHEQLDRVVSYAHRRIPRPGPYHRIQLARAHALLNGQDAEQWHQAAISEPSAGQWPFELANARLEYGAWLRRRYRQTDARTQLQSAHDTFSRLGTPAWTELARMELRAAGVTTTEPAPASWHALTPQEREVVRLAAAGMTNPEIAATLYLSPRTVSTHLYNAFPKLGVSSRSQLRDAIPAEVG